MSIVKLPQDSFDIFTLIARPQKSYSSSSDDVSGDVQIYKRISDSRKESAVFNDKFFDATLESLLIDASGKPTSDIFSTMERYMKGVHDLPIDLRSKRSVKIKRIEPPVTLTTGTLVKNIIKDSLIPHYRVAHPQIGWGYTNYCSIHFPSGVGPTSSSIIYPNPVVGGNAIYSPEKEFTIEFYVNPSYSSTTYSAGTIMHMSSCFAVSMISGSSKDHTGHPDSFRLLLQLSHSADINPSSLNVNSLGTYPRELAYVSKDGLIKKNNWHHVAISWSSTHNDSTGSFYVDGESAGTFACNRSFLPFLQSKDGRSAIFIGNYYDGVNTPSTGPHGFFSSHAVNNEGVKDAFGASPTSPEYPSNHSMKNPFHGELHEIRIWNRARTTSLIYSGSKKGVEIGNGLLFYVPPFFVKETRERSVLRTPFFSHITSTDSPYNSEMSFRVDGHEINLENHLREFVQGHYPRLLHLTSSTSAAEIAGKDANFYLYSNGSSVKRNMTIMPCDNGKFFPNFNILLSGSTYSRGSAMEKFVNDNGRPDLSWINMRNVVQPSAYPKTDSTLISDDGPTPDRLVTDPGETVMCIENRTGDVSSNSVTMFDMSNLFYGSSVYPSTFEVKDNSFTGSNGTMKLVVKDNGVGSLYRASADSIHAKWSSVGFILYKEGLSTITCPYFGEMFGKDDFTINLNGTQHVNVMEINAIAPAWQLNSSSNPTWEKMKLNDYANEDMQGFVNIGRLNFHDDNLNIIARGELAQPINKRSSDRIMFRAKMDI